MNNPSLKLRTINKKQQLGLSGEQAVANYLKQKEFKIVAQNYRTKLGEIDLIAQKGEVLAFIEVKTRKNTYFPISDVITLSKQRKICRTAQIYIVQNNIIDKVCRFDVATVVVDGNNYKVDYIPNAFQQS